jgi:uncharacterized protein (TIGR03083 family)
VSTSKFETNDMSAHLEVIRADADLMSAAIRTGDSSTTIAACPDWDLSQLAEHTGWVHRWATDALINSRAPDRETDFGPSTDDDLAVWIVDGATALINAIRATKPDAPTWHPFSLEQQVWVWARRQALETAMHRWDAQTAIGVQAMLDPELSSEGIQEYFEMGLPRVLGCCPCTTRATLRFADRRPTSGCCSWAASTVPNSTSSATHPLPPPGSTCPTGE